MAEDNPIPSDSAAVEALCRAAAGGDAHALERLLWLHHGRLLSFIRRKVGVDWQGKIDPEDVLQETYVGIFADIGDFAYRGPDSFYHWAARRIDHRFIDQVRHWRRKKRDAARDTAAAPVSGSLSRHELLLERCLPETATPSRALRRADAVAAMLTGLARLPEDYRVVVQRLYLNEEPLAAVAADLGRTEDAVRRLAGRALEKLQEHLGHASRYFSGQDA